METDYRPTRINGHNSRPMTQQQAELFILATEIEMKNWDIPEERLPFLSQIVKKRVIGMKLPVSFTDAAYLTVSAFTDTPGEAVLLLMDTLEKFKDEKDKVVNTNDLTMMYPMGFYSEDAVDTIIDKEIKTKKRPFSEVYNILGIE